MMQRLWIVGWIVAIALACGGIGLAYEYDLTADYAIWAIDELEQAAVVQKSSQGSSATGVIDPTVFAYGWNDDFIIAQRYPDRETVNDMNAALIEWYILVVATETVHGPLTEVEYHQLREALGVVPANLAFSHRIEIGSAP